MKTISDLQGNIYEFNLKLSSNKNTIKIIDLLNKIAKGEEVPEKINYDGFIYIKNNDGDIDFYVRENSCVLLLDEINSTHELNDEVEIIEEDKEIIIDIDKWGIGALEEIGATKDYKIRDLQKYIELLMYTQNEIIDKLIELIDKFNKLKRGE